MNIKFLVTAAAFMALTTGAMGMSRWSALAMIESGNNDRAVGERGEVSRYQILPRLWPGGDPRNGHEALIAARSIMRSRLKWFEKTHRRAPTDFEFYVLWNAPWEVNHPSTIVAERAERFSNLVHG
ncbi:MAG: hypothetical protein KGR98_12240 [Verrucomicrobia bacterium]|nr:hypothetical protein [Verrucomicrobiota bacterium]MDE3100320.1 hypothetical protein [Verrucomicrobiota bacterium]